LFMSIFCIAPSSENSGSTIDVQLSEPNKAYFSAICHGLKDFD
jgi:hypothetical protein